MIHNVVQAVPKKDYTVLVYFDDGKIVLYDARNVLKNERLAYLNSDVEKFMKSCKILNDTLAFDVDGANDETTCFDIAPDTLYELENIKTEDEPVLLAS